MVEAGAQEITEEDMLAAMTFGQEAIAAFCEKQAEFLAKVDPQPKEWPIHVADPSIAERVDNHFDEMSAALKDADKLARMAKVEEVKNSVKENDFTEEERAAWGSDIAAALKSLEKHAMRKMVIETGERADGRSSTEIRPLYIKAGYLPRVHGSGLFQRGDDVFDVGGRGQIDRRRFQPQPAGADFDLIGRLFARNVVAFRPFGQVGDAGTDLQQQSRFADTGIAADQNDRTGHQPAAANAVKLADVGMQTLKHLRRTA